MLGTVLAVVVIVRVGALQTELTAGAMAHTVTVCRMKRAVKAAACAHAIPAVAYVAVLGLLLLRGTALVSVLLLVAQGALWWSGLPQC